MEEVKAGPVVETAVGPGAIAQQGVDPKPLLEEVGEFNYVELLNPLSVTFIGQAALTTAITAPMRVGDQNPDGAGITKNENDIRQVYGFDLRSQAQQSGKTHVLNRIPIESGKTVRLLGGEAKVVLGQLTNVYMQRIGKGHLLANAHERRIVEEQIVQRVGDLRTAMAAAPLSVQQQLKSALDSLDDQPGALLEGASSSGETEFPGLENNRVGTNSVEGDPSQPAPDDVAKRGPGRPKAS